MNKHDWALPNPATAIERAIVVVLADLSGSMSESTTAPAGDVVTRHQELTQGLRDLVSPPSASVRGRSMHDARDFDSIADFAVGTFQGSSQTPISWLAFPAGEPTVAPFYAGRSVTRLPTLPMPAGQTPMGEALLQAIPVIEQHRQHLRNSVRVPVKRPILFLITDGGPSTSVQAAEKALRTAEAAKHLLFFAIGTHQANDEVMQFLAPTSYYSLAESSMSMLIEFLSSTMGEAMAADPNASANTIYKTMLDQWTQRRQNHQAARARDWLK